MNGLQAALDAAESFKSGFGVGRSACCDVILRLTNLAGEVAKSDPGVALAFAELGLALAMQEPKPFIECRCDCGATKLMPFCDRIAMRNAAAAWVAEHFSTKHGPTSEAEIEFFDVSLRESLKPTTEQLLGELKTALDSKPTHDGVCIGDPSVKHAGEVTCTVCRARIVAEGKAAR